MNGLNSLVILLTIIINTISSQLNGSGLIGAHHYSGDDNSSSQFCGISYKQMDLSRVTSVKGLGNKDCGTCIKVTSNMNSKTVYVIAVDIGGNGLDINKEAFKVLSNGKDSGSTEASWEVSDAGNCVGIIQNSAVQLPGIRTNPDQLNNAQSLTGSSLSVPNFSSNSSTNECEAGALMRCISNQKFIVCSNSIKYEQSCTLGTTCRNKGNYIECV